MAEKPGISLKTLPSWIGVFLLRIAVMLPLRIQLLLSTVIATLISPLVKRRKAIIEINLKLCFPDLDDKALKQLTRKTMISSIQGSIEMAMCWWKSDQALKRMSTIEGLELVEHAIKEGRGVLLFGVHFTTLELGGKLFSLYHDMDITYRQQNNPVINYFILKHRERAYEGMFEKNEIKKAIRSLKKGHVVWYAIDQNYGKKNSVFAPFFNEPAATLASTGRMLKMTNAKALMLTHYRVIENGRVIYKLKVCDPFDEPFTDDEQRNAEIINRAYESVVRVKPEQYMWGHRRFKSRPEGMKLAYPPKKKKKQSA